MVYKMIRLTKKRRKILEALKKAKGFISARELSSRLDDVDTATVYRNLDAFEKEGKVRKINLDSGEALYEFVRDVHHHTVCSICNKVCHISIPKEKISELAGLGRLREDTIEVIIRGKCK